MTGARFSRRTLAALGALLLTTALARADERVDITAMDGVQLIGELAGAIGPGVVLTHDEQADRRSWMRVSERLAGQGFRVLRFDLRGHGDSGGTIDLAASDRDVEGAYRYLLARKIRPVFLVGAGAGGAASLVVAARVPVEGVVVVSSPATAATPDRSASADLRVPVLALASGPAGLDGSPEIESLVRFLRDPKGATVPANR